MPSSNHLILFPFSHSPIEYCINNEKHSWHVPSLFSPFAYTIKPLPCYLPLSQFPMYFLPLGHIFCCVIIEGEIHYKLQMSRTRAFCPRSTHRHRLLNRSTLSNRGHASYYSSIVLHRFCRLSSCSSLSLLCYYYGILLHICCRRQISVSQTHSFSLRYILLRTRPRPSISLYLFRAESRSTIVPDISPPMSGCIFRSHSPLHIVLIRAYFHKMYHIVLPLALINVSV